MYQWQFRRLEPDLVWQTQRRSDRPSTLLISILITNSTLYIVLVARSRIMGTLSMKFSGKLN